MALGPVGTVIPPFGAEADAVLLRGPDGTGAAEGMGGLVAAGLLGVIACCAGAVQVRLCDHVGDVRMLLPSIDLRSEIFSSCARTALGAVGG